MDYTKVLGVVACLSCSPNPGIEPWRHEGDQIWQCTLMWTDSIKKRSIVYMTALVSAARETRDANEHIDTT